MTPSAQVTTCLNSEAIPEILILSESPLTIYKTPDIRHRGNNTSLKILIVACITMRMIGCRAVPDTILPLDTSKASKHGIAIPVKLWTESKPH